MSCEVRILQTFPNFFFVWFYRYVPVFFKYSIYHSEVIFLSVFRFRCHCFRRLFKQFPESKTFVYLNFAVSNSSLSSYITLFANNHMSYHSRLYFSSCFPLLDWLVLAIFFLHLRSTQRHLCMLLILCPHGWISPHISTPLLC